MLRKAFERVRVPGSPEVAAQEGGYFCYSQPAPGHWEMQCSNIDIPIGTSIQLPPNTFITYTRDAEGNIIKITAYVCVSCWVTTGPAGPTTCTTYPPVAYQPAIPSRIESRPIIGWDAGANSVTSRGGNCEAKWTMGTVVGCYIGFTDQLDDVTLIDRYSHAIYFHQNNGRPVFRLVEFGEAKSADIPYVADDEFRIRRVEGVVTYWHAGVVIYTSSEISSGSINVGSTLYASGDTIP